MELRILKEKDNRVLGRKELAFEVENARTTPSRKELRKRIAALKNSKEELVSVYAAKQCYGQHLVKGTAFVYKDIERLERIEPKYLIERENKEKKEKPAEEKKGKEEAGGKAAGGEEKPAEGKPWKGEKAGKPEAAEEKPAEKEEKNKGKPEGKKEGAKEGAGEGREEKE